MGDLTEDVFFPDVDSYSDENRGIFNYRNTLGATVKLIEKLLLFFLPYSNAFYHLLCIVMNLC